MRAIESSPIEDLEGEVEGTRFFVVQVLDPESRLYVRGSIAIPPGSQVRWRRRCVDMGVGFEEGLPHVAAAEVMQQLWGPVWPEGHEVTSIEEVSREELLERVRVHNGKLVESAS